MRDSGRLLHGREQPAIIFAMVRTDPVVNQSHQTGVAPSRMRLSHRTGCMFWASTAFGLHVTMTIAGKFLGRPQICVPSDTADSAFVFIQNIQPLGSRYNRPTPETKAATWGAELPGGNCRKMPMACCVRADLQIHHIHAPNLPPRADC